jgi:hypothetical protein
MAWTLDAPFAEDHDLSPLVTPELSRDPGRAQPRMTEGEGHDPLLDERGSLVRHFRPTPLPWPRDLRAEPEHLAAPPIGHVREADDVRTVGVWKPRRCRRSGAGRAALRLQRAARDRKRR